MNIYSYLLLVSGLLLLSENLIRVNNNNNNIIVDLTTYCINSDRNVIKRNDLCLYVQLHYSNFNLRYSPING